jgi:signal transduction histidine kinase
VRRRILTAILTVALGAILLLAVPLGLAAGRLYKDEELNRLERAATAASRAVDASARQGDPPEFRASADRLSAYDLRGRRTGGFGPPRADAIVLRALRSGALVSRGDDSTLRAAVPVTAGERVVGAVRAERPASALNARVRDARVLLAGLGLLIALAASAAAVLLSRRLAQPLHRLAGTAERLGHGDFSVRASHFGVPELDALAGALEATAGRLGELVARERSFSADASHQLRTPLAALRLELEAQQLEEGEGSDGADRVLAEVDRLEGTIETLLAVARDDPRAATVIEPPRLLDELGERWHGRLAGRGRALRRRTEPSAPTAFASEGVTREILDVLLDNAFSHGAGTVSVTARGAAGALAIDVSDEGAGVKSNGDTVFERREGSGTGIGLALARALAESEGGRLTLDGAGPTFTLLLPGGPAPSQGHCSTSSQPPA